MAPAVPGLTLPPEVPVDAEPDMIAFAVPVPRGTAADGAVAELAVQPDGTVTAEIRIPGPAVP